MKKLLVTFLALTFSMSVFAQKEHIQIAADYNSQSDNSQYTTPDNNNYQGRWYGTASGWEVRFKQTYGEFASQFAGLSKGDLPFDNEEIIMSLTVHHGASFYIDVDENNNITGEGTIFYDLVPNLCAVAALTESVNNAINSMEKIGSLFKLSGKLAQASAKDFSYTFLGLKGKMAKAAKMGQEAYGSKPYNYLVDFIENNLNKFYLDHQKRETLCKCSAGIPLEGDGTQVGPATLDELVSEFGVNVAKSMFSDVVSLNAPAGVMLKVPGVTQIQYNYEGMIDRPQERTFGLSGKIVDGKMYLEIDKIEGDNNLPIAYTVNYQTDKASFPVWSPFMPEPGIINTAGKFTFYDYEEKEAEREYTNPQTGKKEKITIIEQNLIPIEEEVDSPYAEFTQSGIQRNNISVWHEYEYNWSLFKFE